MMNSNVKSTAQFATKEQSSLFIDKTAIQKSVSAYYGKTLQSSKDLKTNACVTGHMPNPAVKDAIRNIHPDVLDKYYGCGFCTPDLLDGMTVLDLGCGSGRDVYIASQLVGPNGKVIGVDMTEEQLATAKEFQSYHAEKFGYDNVEFHHGLIEKLDEISGLKDGSVDIIISNCVINLCSDKEAVLKNCYRLLKEGGELYFSDVYSNRRIPQSLREDEVMWGECLSGALYWNDFHNLAKQCGFKDPRLVEDAPITVSNKNVQDKIDRTGYSELNFFSATYRLMKLSSLDFSCEDYGQAVIYKGTIPRFESGWSLDNHHFMESGKVFPVCGNTYNMLKQTRFENHFEFIGDFSKHYGIFEGCGTSMPYSSNASSSSDASTCATGSCC
jgi:SAM-dependent methyltransferase